MSSEISIPKKRGNPNWVRKESNLPVNDLLQEAPAIEKRVKVPGTYFEVDQDGYLRVPKELLDKLMKN